MLLLWWNHLIMNKINPVQTLIFYTFVCQVAYSPEFFRLTFCNQFSFFTEHNCHKYCITFVFGNKPHRMLPQLYWTSSTVWHLFNAHDTSGVGCTPIFKWLVVNCTDTEVKEVSESEVLQFRSHSLLLICKRNIGQCNEKKVLVKISGPKINK
jgi:hypothetical protein